jgi:hypothetical protein
MSYAYTPGLKVKERAHIVKRRILPVRGEVLVKKGDKISYKDVVARTFVPGDVYVFPVADEIGVEGWELPNCVFKKEGDTVEEGELLARSTVFFGLFKREYHAELSGTIEVISNLTGKVVIRGKPVPINVKAYISGEVEEIVPGEGAVISTYGTYVQGILGIGGERHTELRTIASNDEILTDDKIGPDCRGKILVGGSLVTYPFLKRAEEIGVNGIVTGGIKRSDLTKFLGYEFGVAITGDEDISLTCIIVEGAGDMAMAERTYKLLSNREGDLAAINGATQIRAGVIRPEVIVPDSDGNPPVTEDEVDFLPGGMDVRTPVRIIRQPYFGAIGEVAFLPVELQLLETRSLVRVVDVKLLNGEVVRVPRANVEIIEV